MPEKKMTVAHRSLFGYFLDVLVGQAAPSGMLIGAHSVYRDNVVIKIRPEPSTGIASCGTVFVFFGETW